jgi:hypothetical protein
MLLVRDAWIFGADVTADGAEEEEEEEVVSRSGVVVDNVVC